MNKMREYERGREDGLDLARRIVKEGGLEALERECKFRGVTGIHTSLAAKDLDKASQKIKEMTIDTFTILCIAAVHDEFGFGEKRCRRLIAKMEEGAEYEELIAVLLDDAESFVLAYTMRTKIIQPLEKPVRDLAVIALNRMGTEGENSRSEGGETYNFNDAPKQIFDTLNRYRICRVGGKVYENKKK